MAFLDNYTRDIGAAAIKKMERARFFQSMISFKSIFLKRAVFSLVAASSYVGSWWFCSLSY